MLLFQLKSELKVTTFIKSFSHLFTNSINLNFVSSMSVLIFAWLSVNTVQRIHFYERFFIIDVS